MPYIEVVEVPEGADEADVVERARYEELLAQLKSAEEQRDRLAEEVVEGRDKLRDAKARYAGLVLDSREAKHQEAKPGEGEAHSLPLTLEELFS